MKHRSLLAAAYRYGVPIYTSSPGDSSIGMNVAAKALEGKLLAVRRQRRRERDRRDRLGREIRRRKERGLDPGRRESQELPAPDRAADPGSARHRREGPRLLPALTDARPDTGGLSGATPAEAVSWGKIDPDQLPGTVICYADSTLTLPLLTAYALARARAAQAQAPVRPARGSDAQAQARLRNHGPRRGSSEQALTVTPPPVLAELGDRDVTLNALERALEKCAHWFAAIKLDPSLDPLRGNRRFDDILRRVGV